MKAAQIDMFDAGGDPLRETFADLRSRLVRFASGLTRSKDLIAAAYAGHGVGIEIGELSTAALADLARCAVDYRTPIFADSGAFGVFRRNLKRRNGLQHLDFAKVLAGYDRLFEAIEQQNAAEERLPPPLVVMPDVVGDQLASIALVREHRAYARALLDFPGVGRPIVPLQRGPLSLADAYRIVSDVLDSPEWIVGLPSNAAAVTPAEFTAFLREARPKSVHILGAFADSRLDPRLAQVLASGHHAIELSADANPLRSIIICKGQGAPARAATLVERLGVRARRQELADWVVSLGGREGVRAAFLAGDADRQRRILALICDLGGMSADEAFTEYELRAPEPIAA